MDIKRCSGCKQEKRREEFYNDTRNSDGLQSRCKACFLQYSKERNKKQEVKSRRREYDRLYRRTHRDQKSFWDKKYCRAHAEQRNEYQRKYRKNHQEQTTQSYKKYASLNKEKINIKNANRKNKFGTNLGRGVTLKEWELIKAIYNNCCFYCGEKRKLTIDHVVPITKNGYHSISNIVPACQPCNSSKGAKDANWFIGKDFQNE